MAQVDKAAVEAKLAEHRERRKEVLEKRVVKAEQEAMKDALPRKALQYERLPNGLYSLSFVGGGELPDELKGTFTALRHVMDAAAKYGKLEVLAK